MNQHVPYIPPAWHPFLYTLGVSKRAGNVLARLGVKDAAELLSVTEQKLRDVRNCGKVLIAEIKRAQKRVSEQGDTCMKGPILVVAGCAVRDGKVLVARRGPGDPRWEGLWEFPGGKVEAGEHPAEALAREWLEEIGAAIRPASGPLRGVYSGRTGDRHYVVLAWRIEIVTPEPEWKLDPDSISETRWVPRHEVGWLQPQMPSLLPLQLALAFEMGRVSA